MCVCVCVLVAPLIFGSSALRFNALDHSVALEIKALEKAIVPEGQRFRRRKMGYA